ncbi:Protein of uncharacterised function (DUF3170) [Schaalia odontolytica]|uniref:Protein of uncharacterized function (DUF3170) n=1 Tax=Schaalia odontolytica TaxID=1660 RepID=A0A2X0U2V6_9ACTO|nr:Protein of uncharacterised function (DUF3170) [Schaalia odontolytica]
MVGLVLGGDTTQDRDGILNRRFADEHLLEAALERRVLFDVLAILVESGRAYHAQLTAGEHGLEHVARIHRPLGAAARTDDRVQLVDEGNDLTVRARDLREDSLEALFKLAAILRTGNHRGHIQGDETLVTQRLGNITRDNALSETFDDGSLADAGFTDQDRVVLRAPGEDLDDTADLVVTANNRVKLSFARNLSEVTAVLGQSLERTLRVSRGDRVGAQLGERLRECVGLDPGLRQDAPRLGLRGSQRDE